MAVLQTLLEITVYSAVIFISTMLLKKAFRNNMSPMLHYAVWALLIIRLMLPVTIDSGLKLFVIPQEKAQTQQQSANVSEEYTRNTQQSGSTGTPYTYNDLSAEVHGAGTAADRPAEPVFSKAAPSWNLSDILLTVWLAGVGASLIYAALCYAVLRLRVARDTIPAKERLLRLFKQCRRELGIKRDVKVLAVYNAGTPSLLIPSTVLMPTSLLVSADDEQITYALRHELTHYKRKDHIVNALLVLLQAIYWFNPFVWLAFKQIRQDIEVACDSEVVKTLDNEEKCRYAGMVVSLFAVTRRQMALGMAGGNTKKAAETRVRGIFMNGSSKRSSKLVSVMLAAVLLFTCFTTACQPTPEAPVIAPKNETYEERETTAAQPGTTTKALTREDLGIPDHVTESYDMGDILSLSIDADVKTGEDLTLYKVYKGELKNFTQQQVNHFADMFVKGIDLTAYDDRNTKDEITEYFLLPAQKTLSELQNGTYVKDPNMDGDTPTIDSIKEQISMYEQWIVDAPEQRSSDTVTIDSYEKSNNYFYGEFPIEGSKITGKFMAGAGVRNECGGFSYYNSSYDLKEPYNMRPEPISMALPEGGLNLKTTPDEAIALATQIKNELGADELEFYAVMQARTWAKELDTEEIAAYYVVFTRCVDGIPVIYCSESMMNGGGFSAGQANEKLVVTVDDTGVIAVNWLGNTEITGLINENPRFISFNKALEAARKQVAAIYSFSPDGGELRERQDVKISSISLEYLRMKEPNGGDNDVRFVPAWVFDGEYKIVYSDEAVRENEAITQKEEICPLGRPIVVNALDGSAFDILFADGVEPPSMYIKPVAPKG